MLRLQQSVNKQWRSNPSTSDDANFAAHRCCSNSARVGNPAIPPKHLVDRAPQRTAVLRQLCGSFPPSQAYKNPASKQSPAPVVSNDATSTGSQNMIFSSYSNAAPEEPNLRATFRSPIFWKASRILRGSLSPVMSVASRLLGKKISA